MKSTDKFKKLTTKTLISAVDFSKSKHTGYFTTLTGEDNKPFQFANTRKGFEKYWHKLKKFKESHGLEDVIVSFESTGSYGVPFIHFLRGKGVKMLQVNPKHTKRAKEVSDNSPNKNDNKDPRVIADLILMRNGLTVNIAEGKIQALRNQIYNRETLIEDQTRMVNRTEAFLAIYFPEFSRLFKSILGKTSLYILRHYPLPKDLLETDFDRLKQEFKKVSRGRVDKEKTREIIEYAKESVGVTEGEESYRQIMNNLLDQIEIIQAQKEQVENEVSRLLKGIPSSRILLSVKGLGEISVAAILSEIIDFKSFETIGEIDKYAGFNLFEISSGEYQGKRKIAKRGRALLRKTLFFATLNMVKKGGIFHLQYQHHVNNKKMPKKKAVIALSRKLLRMIFAMVRDDKMFEWEKLKPIKQAA